MVDRPEIAQTVAGSFNSHFDVIEKMLAVKIELVSDGFVVIGDGLDLEKAGGSDRAFA